MEATLGTSSRSISIRFAVKSTKECRTGAHFRQDAMLATQLHLDWIAADCKYDRRCVGCVLGRLLDRR